jgi:hypothetical protein
MRLPPSSLLRPLAIRENDDSPGRFGAPPHRLVCETCGCHSINTALSVGDVCPLCDSGYLRELDPDE